MFAYDDASRRTTMTYPNGVVTSYTYDELDRLLRIRAVNAQQQAITDFQYEYDDAGNRTRKSALDYAEDYRYDEVDRLVEVTRSGLPGHWLYAYDRVGNRLTEQIGDAVSSWTYNEKNQLLSRTGGGPLRFRGTVTEPSQVWVAGKPATLLPGNAFEATVPVTVGTNVIPVTAQDPSGNVKTRHYQVEVPSVSAAYTYDANGNLATKVEGGHTWTYEWNAENELKRVTKDTVEVARFSYDPLGRRVEKVAGSTTTPWTYADEDILRQGGSSATKYVHGTGTDEPLATEDGSGLSHLHADGLGSIASTTSGSGASTFSRRYDAWGTSEVGGGTTGYAFTGREWDPEAGLHYYRVRYYDPSIGRFLSEDPLRWDPANLYSYVHDNPVTHTDPLGLFDWDDALVNPSALWGGYVENAVSPRRCTRFGDRLSENMRLTNGLVPGSTVPPGTGIVLGGGRVVGKAIGGPTLWGALTGSAAGGTYAGGVTYTAAEAVAAGIGTAALTGAAIGSAFEVGALAESSIDAAANSCSCR